MGLQRLERKPGSLGSLDLFRALDLVEGRKSLVSDPARIKRVLSQIEMGLNTVLSTESTVHGWRVQGMFSSLVVAMDGCELLKQEDSGDVFFDGDRVKVPDYRLTLRDSRRLLVEVKSVRPRSRPGPLRLGVGEFDGLRRYADLVGDELFIASYWAGWNSWALVPIGALEPSRGVRELVFEDAIGQDHMSLLGDRMIGVVPPIELRFVADPAKPRGVGAGGRTEFTIGGVGIAVGGETLEDETDRNIAFFLFRFGGWPVREEPTVEAGQFERISLIAEPASPVPGQAFEVVGRLSSMYSTLFNEATLSELGVTALEHQARAGMLPALIPAGYGSKSLPLWHLVLRPGIR